MSIFISYNHHPAPVTMAKQEKLSGEQLHLLLLYDFKSEVKAAESHRRINAAFGEGTISQRTCYDWFTRFESGDLEVKDKTHPGRPSAFDNDALQTLVEANPKLTVDEMAQHLGTSHGTIINHLRQIGKVFKHGKWIPHQLSNFDKDRRFNACLQNLANYRTKAHLANLVTGDEKWTLFYNVSLRGEWRSRDEPVEPTPKAPLVQRKIMLCVWWDVKGVILYELLPSGTTVNTDVYTGQLDRLDQAIKAKRQEIDKVHFLHDNAPAHRSRKSTQKLLELNWAVLTHPPYSPDLAPTDYHLFRSLQNHIKDKRFESEDELKVMLDDFFNQKPASFYRDGIHDLLNRWQYVTDHFGEYYPD